LTLRYVVRAVTDAADMRALEDVQVAAWGYADREVLPGTMFRISAASGGVVVAAYPEGSGTPFGLAYGFPALRDGRAWHHSHLLAVHPDWRGSGAAVALKLEQARLARAQGLTHMTWTFDPLVARNARLNLGKLGARAVSYHPAWYDLPAPTSGPAVPADRLMIEWDLNAPHAEQPAPTPDGEPLLTALPDGTPGPFTPRPGAPRTLAEVPTAADTLPGPLRLAWRLALREALGTALRDGYVVTGLARRGDRAWYVLEPGHGSGLY